MRALRIVTPALVIALFAATGSARPAGPADLARPALAPAARPVDAVAARSGGLRVLFIGASVTDGWFASAPERTYPALVVQGLSAGGRRVNARILAQPGVTASGADVWDFRRIPADLAIVQLATNDYIKSEPVLVFSAYYADILHRVRAASPAADLICLGGWDDPDERNGLGVPAVEYDVAARDACGAEGGTYVDLSAIYLDTRNHGPAGRPAVHGTGDLFHPNDRGHAELAALVLAAVRR